MKSDPQNTLEDIRRQGQTSDVSQATVASTTSVQPSLVDMTTLGAHTSKTQPPVVTSPMDVIFQKGLPKV